MREAIHRDPVWRSQADFVIGVSIDPQSTSVSTEQLWAKKVGPTRYQVCCVPFFAYDLALGDIVEVDASYMIERVVARSGRFVFRVYFPEAMFGVRDEVIAELTGLGALVEWSSSSMFAVDVPHERSARAVSDYLSAQEAQGRLIYETGKTR
ncbi:hypothetical protein A0130_13550 [Leifsonia xyli]|uniref:DUF4265 domain-containing protein n=1 Tax=Leifsonia xyli TaxID=1575 RepID=UPI0007CDE1C8|nr:hypothetical protein A0130_13550 [Leifsonia xyli]